MNEFFFSALSFGLAASIKPGPLGIVVIQQTLSRGLPAGVRASLAPLIFAFVLSFFVLLAVAMGAVARRVDFRRAGATRGLERTDNAD